MSNEANKSEERSNTEDTSVRSEDVLSEEQRKKIVSRLESRGVGRACPMCGENHWVVADGFFNHSVQGEIHKGMVLGGPSIPSTALICRNCGFISQHALGVLGMLPSQEG